MPRCTSAASFWSPWRRLHQRHFIQCSKRRFASCAMRSRQGRQYARYHDPHWSTTNDQRLTAGSRHNDPASRFLRDNCRLLLGKLSKEKVDEGPRSGPAGGVSVAQPDQERQSLEHVGIAQGGVSQLFLLDVTILLQHLSHLRRSRVLGRGGQRLLVVQPRVPQPLLTGAEGRECRNQIAIVQAAVGIGCLGQSVAEAHEQMLALVGELLRDLNLQEQRCGFELVGGTRLLVLPRLLQVRAVAGTVQCHLALLATALGAHAAVHGGTEALFLADLAKRATQIRILLSSIMAPGGSEARSSSVFYYQ